MVWYIIAGITVAIALLLLVLNFIRDRRYERRRVLDAMSPGLKAEIEDERARALDRKERFRDALDEAIDRDAEGERPPHDAAP